MQDDFEKTLAEVQMRRAQHEPIRTFKMQQKNDRNAATTAVTKAIKILQFNGSWASMTIQNRIRVVREEYQQKMDSRGKHKKQGSTKAWFPREHNEAVELHWLLDEFDEEINQGSKKKAQRTGQKEVSYDERSDDEDDQDDEEMVVKREDSEDEEGSSEEGESGSETETETESESESEEESREEIEAQHSKHDLAAQPASSAGKKRTAPFVDDEAVKKRLVYTVTSRGMPISNGIGAKRARSVGWPWFKVAGG